MQPKKVLVACEFSGTVRDAFLARDHDATSCDLLPTDSPGPHYQGDVRDILGDGWDLMVAHPPCTYLAASGYHRTVRGLRPAYLTEDALEFFRILLGAPIPQIAIENPVGVVSSRIRPPDQTIQPWQYGHGDTKATCLWLKNLPRLTPTNPVPGREQRLYNLPPGPNRWRLRSATYPGIAAAMADQWGAYCLEQLELFA